MSDLGVPGARRPAGVWERLSSVPDQQLGDFIANAGRAVESAVEIARSTGWQVVEVANGDDRGPGELVHLYERIPSPIGDGRGPLYRARLLRPGRLKLRVRGAVARPDLAPATLDGILDDYGLNRAGKAHNLAFALRSESAWVGTDDGRVVVRVYRQHWPDQVIRHEHSVLRHLESTGYPAVRLLTRLDRETITRVGERRVAVFRFSEGVNLAGSVLIPSDGWVEASRLLGTLLARLHRATAGFVPQGAHHLSLDADDPIGARLEAQLETLGSLAASPANHPDAAWLQARASDIERRLVRLAGVVADSDLEVSVIHGDFGFHNVLLRRDGGATVHDFELARRDWCLVDVVETISPMPPERAHHLLDGYRSEADGEPKDWQWLAEMWEYHRLGGAVRSWKSFSERGDIDRLAAARARVEEADRVAATGVGAWL
jgi:Ser/Thr protein kinase RdoA (MazF antagonist)